MRLFSLLLLTGLMHLTGYADSTDTLRLDLQPLDTEHLFETPGWHNWGGSILQDEQGLYHLFYSRWPVERGFLGWLTHSEVAVATSQAATGPWTYVRTVLSNRHQGWDAIMAHNPKIKRFGDTYFLFYISTGGTFSETHLREIAATGYRHPDWSVLRNAQRTGVATAKSLEGPFTRPEKPLLEPAPPLHSIVVNPAVTARPDGSVLLMVKGDKGPDGGPRIQAVATGPGPQGPFTLHSTPAISDEDTEDASLWYDHTRARFYAVFHAHHFFGMITSEDGLHWEKARHYRVGPKAFVRTDGSIFRMHRMERPNVVCDGNGIPRVFLSSYTDGRNRSGVLTVPLHPADPAP